MVKKIKQWYYNRKIKKQLGAEGSNLYTREQMEKVYLLGYNDGKRDGLAIAREQATKSLKEILQWQNKSQK